jgi:hypothetical protein
MKMTVETRMAARVAPARGMRSSTATRSPSATAYSLPTAKSTMVERIPATRLMSRLPVT